MHYDKNKTKHRTLTGELLNRQQILDKNDTVKTPCEDGDYFKESPHPGLLIWKGSTSTRIHFIYSEEKNISPSLQVTDQSLKYVPESAKGLNQGL